ncbi:hypothetical protein AC579_2991 [Pseudocercospora musae]|uniref:Extracellular membrane protein CFEM domain-containing protein n=1 Tax=Pseudocercospora musae TaxID=113226 RepID=A0A139I127_9PEZI|nr:hypothetical protein AC579_2991 [Pseudocercospora musae]
MLLIKTLLGACLMTVARASLQDILSANADGDPCTSDDECLKGCQDAALPEYAPYFDGHCIKDTCSCTSTTKRHILERRF